MQILFFYLASALLLWLASPGPGLAYCAWFALVPLLIGCSSVKPKIAARLGFISGLVYYMLLIYWVIIALNTYGHLPMWLCLLALLLLCAYMSLYLSFFCAACSWSMRSKSQPLWAVPLLWVALDYIRGWLFTGFPWQDLGYSQFSSPLLIQTSDLLGHHGVTFFIVLANCLMFTLVQLILKKDPAKGQTLLLKVLPATLLLILSFSYSLHRQQKITEDMQTAPTHRVTLVQGNIDQDQKWVAEKQRQAMEKYITLSPDATVAQQTNLVVWPETAMPFHPPTSPIFPELLRRTVFTNGYSLLSGAPYFVPDQNEIRLYNSAVLVRPDNKISLYFKQHLVPFGEYMPFSDILPLPGPVVESVGNFSSGTRTTPLVDGPARLGVLICFESIFADLAREEVKNGANLLVNITNDAWYGRSSASIQHLAMVVFRAVENRRSLARAANTGISCFIDPCGRISQPTPIFEEKTITADLPLLEKSTFFNKRGHLFPLICLLLLIPLALYTRKSSSGS